MSEGHSREIWKDVPGYEGFYKVSNKGKVKSLDRMVKNRFGFRFKEGRILRTQKNPKSGVLVVRLYLKGSFDGKDTLVSRLVLSAFVGPCPEGMECCHNDGNPQNNCLENLRWGTHKSNMSDRDFHGRHARGEVCVKAKLTENDVRKIRVLLSDGNQSMNSISISFGVNVATIRDIRDRITWKHVL